MELLGHHTPGEYTMTLPAEGVVVIIKAPRPPLPWAVAVERLESIGEAAPTGVPTGRGAHQKGLKAKPFELFAGEKAIRKGAYTFSAPLPLTLSSAAMYVVPVACATPHGYG